MINPGPQTHDDICRLGHGIVAVLGSATFTDRSMVRYYTETRVAQLERGFCSLEDAEAEDCEYVRDVSRRVSAAIPQILNVPAPKAEWRLRQ